MHALQGFIILWALLFFIVHFIIHILINVQVDVCYSQTHALDFGLHRTVHERTSRWLSVTYSKYYRFGAHIYASNFDANDGDKNQSFSNEIVKQ